MYRLILVDDEVIFLESMKKAIDFREYGFQLMGTFRNPIQALQEIESLRPDLIVTDVRMPLLDGLELSRRAKKRLPDVEIVLLSGYNDFKYAQTAMKIGVRDYLLKPVKKSEIGDMLCSMRDRLDEKRKKQDYLDTLQSMVAQNYNESSDAGPETGKSTLSKSEETIGGVIEESDSAENVSGIIRAAVAYMETHYQEDLSLSDVAEQINVSKNYLSNLFHKEMDINFVGYLTKIRMEKAEQLLAETNMKMYEVGSAVGYQDYAYFCTLFKKYEGKTLSEYRKEHSI